MSINAINCDFCLVPNMDVWLNPTVGALGMLYGWRTSLTLQALPEYPVKHVHSPVSALHVPLNEVGGVKTIRNVRGDLIFVLPV